MLAQISEGGLPPSFLYGNNIKRGEGEPKACVYKLEEDITKLKWEDTVVEDNGGPVRVAAIIPAVIDILQSGEWSTLPDGQKVCKIAVKSPEAKGIILSYSEFYIPEGGKLFIYNADKDQILGAYTHNTNPVGKEFSTEIVYGDELILEYVNSQKEDLPRIKIADIGYVYSDYRNTTRDEIGFGKSKSCEVNINCSEGTNWQRQKRGVAKTFTKIGNAWYACSGTLINNTEEDFIPYYLSAYHCFFTSTNSADFNTMQFYFHYELDGCDNASETEAQVNARTKTMIGAQLLVANPIYGGIDGALLKLKTDIPENYDLVFNGWDISTTAASSGVSIHHPSADVKKISTYTTSLRTGTYLDRDGVSTANAHWLVRFVATSNGHGITEGGSSGSPLFNQDGRIVGTLTGGSTTCANPNQDDYYSKFYYQWDKGNDDSGKQMKEYLDPNNKGLSHLDLIAQLPDIIVSTDTINIKENTSIKINILSGNGNYTVTSSDTEIVTASVYEVSEENSVVIKGLKSGQATITIKDIKNKKKNIVVYVYPADSDPVTLRLVDNILSINLMSGSSDYISAVSITDLWGRIVYTESDLKDKLLHQIDTSAIGKGVYIVKMKTNKGYTKTQKIKW